MRYLTEYRDAAIARPLIESIRRTATKPWGKGSTLIRWRVNFSISLR